ncbi:hypothetical protein GCM10010276_34020 [Streptomyces longisporus]|uniref:chorismate synthase n=1 Tax=Streptomyces longisporus TaxID=1948 RepID=A0ABN3LWM5_STRLO
MVATSGITGNAPLGEVARSFLAEALGVALVSHVVELGTAKAPSGTLPIPEEALAVDADPLRSLDPAVSAAMVAEIDAAHRSGDTLGGVIEVLAYGLPPGLGSHVHWDRRLDARLAAGLLGIQAIKSRVGDGFDLARSPGSLAHDEIVPGDPLPRRASGRSGGIEGGISTGEPLRVRAAMKPIATVPRALAVDTSTGRPAWGPSPTLRRVCGTRGGRGGRGDGRPRTRGRGGREVRRRLRCGDPAQC